MHKSKGLTLFELLIALSISGVLLGLAIPGFGIFIEKSKSELAIENIFRAYQYARHYAINENKRVFVCGSQTGTSCDKNWSKLLLVFIDRDDNQQPDPTEIIQYHQLNLTTAKIRSRFALGRAHTILRPDGRASYTGSMIYCPTNKEPGNYNRVTWNDIGRAYKGKDRNKDGIIDDTGGRSLLRACP